MDQDELQYDEGVEGGEGGEESFAAAGEDDHQLNDTDQSIETELEAIKGTLQAIIIILVTFQGYWLLCYANFLRWDSI